MKEYLLVLQKGNIEGDILSSLTDIVNNDAFVDRNIHLLKACCCNIESDRGFTKRRHLQSGLKPEELLGRWLHKSESSLCKSANECPCRPHVQRNLDKWVETTHCYAEFLPKFGCLKRLVWVITEDELSKPEDNLGLLGALKRLVEWHGVKVLILCSPTLSVAAELQLWVDVLYAQVLTTEDKLTLPIHRQLWCGSVTIAGSQGSTLELPGFSLCSHENAWLKSTISMGTPGNAGERATYMEEMFTGCVLSETLELVAPVAISEVPTYLLTDMRFSLSIPSRSKYIRNSKHFIENLSHDRDLGYILRLNTGTSWKERSVKDTNTDKISKKEINKLEIDGEREEEDNEWIKLISNNISNVFAAPNKDDIELAGDTGYYQFLAFHDICGGVIAQLMRKTNQIHPSLIQDLQEAESLRHRCSSNDNESNKEEIKSLLSDVPHWTGANLTELQHDLEQFYALILQQWINEHTEKGEATLMTPEYLLKILEVARKKFFEVHASSYSSERIDEDQCIMLKPKPAYLDDPYSQLERRVLLMREAQEESAKNGPSGLSPPKAKVLALDARQFLKFFKKDGTAAKEPIGVTLQKSPKRGICKYDSGNLRLEKWPHCKFYRYHDIYYYTEGVTEELEALCEKMKARLVNMETASTCTYKQTHSTITVQKDIRKLRHKSNKCAKEENTDDHKLKSKINTPKAKTKTDTGLLEKRKRLMQLSKRAQSGKVDQRVKPSPRKPCKKSESSPKKECKTPRKSASQTNQKTPRKSPGKCLTPKKGVTPRKAGTPRRGLKSPSAKKAKEYTLEAKKARAKRHAQLLESILTRVLERHGVSADNKNFKTCFQKLYTITKCFLKDLTTVTSLRAEMESIAEDNVQNVLKRVLKT